MARARNIKPGFFKNEDLSDLSPYARLLFIGLWCLADRDGILEDRPKRIKGELFPYENVEVDTHLQELHDKDFILRYEVDGERYISIPKFADHQNPHHREAASKFPKPSQGNGEHGEGTTQGESQPQDSPGLSSGHADQGRINGEDGQKPHEINDSRKGSAEPRAGTRLGEDKPNKSPADSLIPDSLNLIPDSLIPLPPTTSSTQGRSKTVVVGGRDLHVYKSVIDQYKHYFVYEPNKTIRELLHSYLDDEVQMDMLAWVMRYAAEKGKAWDYAKGTLDKMFIQGVRTAEQAEQANQQFQQQQSQKVVPIRESRLREDKLPASVQWQQEQQASGGIQSDAKSINDYPEMAERLQRLRSKAAES